MIARFINNPFDGRISLLNFYKMALAHLERLKTNNQNGEFKNLINKTQPIFDSFKSKINIKAIEAASKESKTVSVDNIIDETINYIQSKSNLISYVFPKDSPEFQEFFPLGIREYNRASKKTFDKIIFRFLNAAEKHRDKFKDENLGGTIRQFYDTYNDLRNQQLQLIGEVKEQTAEVQKAWGSLSKQMYLNFLELTIVFVDNTERVNGFYDFSMLRKKNRPPEPPAPPVV